VAIDSHPPIPPLDTDLDSPIDNELPAYRALSPLAVLSVVLGIASILVFTSLNFAVLAGIAIVAGLLAQRQIRRQPEIWTGTSMAKLGIGVALVFTLAAFTIANVQSWIYATEATKFAKLYVKAMETGTRDDLVYYQAAPEMRVGKSAKQVADEMAAGGRDAREFEMHNPGMTALGKRLAVNPRPAVEFQGIESQNVQGMTVHAGALVKLVGGPGEKESEYALLHIQGNLQSPGFGWTVSEVQYPHQVKK
jgi:hypothetical protein